ncbi:MAG: tRNA (adenosine(37)-N6)-threonylcarbamoyltransferase complex transferase subunit TsaD [Candidatus Latescibacteria bacterium]|nr:tRNA (adenosine(37)-N6)-threonylcarbamoyltransferase complex transferase subunit TsaD [Candidatus Latescibacterota bacterium]
MIFLGIETSCDETAASVISAQEKEPRASYNILSSIVSSQYVHSQYGGVIPELASRAHIQLIVPITQTALDVAKINYQDLDGIAVTYAPGLVGALLVGLSFTKALSLSLNKPFIGVNHLEGHIFSLLLSYPELNPPFLAMIISGGHTELLLIKGLCDYEQLGSTTDDACGEAFDKVARMLGLPYPGGAFIEKLALTGKRTVKFPVPDIPDYDFSFSGLKTAVLYYLQKEKNPVKENVAYSFQETVSDFLLKKIDRAADHYKINRIGISGGVAINKRIQERFSQYGKEHNLQFYFPNPQMCTDNAAMIAAAGIERYKRFGPSPLSLTAEARVKLI